MAYVLSLGLTPVGNAALGILPLVAGSQGVLAVDRAGCLKLESWMG